MGIPVVLLLLFVLYPLAAIILQSIFPQLYAANPSLIPSLDALKQVTASHENYLALFNSLWLGGITAVLAALLGTTLAILAKRTDLPLRGAMDILVWIVFFTPSFLVGEAWSLVFIRGGIPDQYLHFSDAFISWFYSPVGVIFILSLKTFPYVYLSVSSALRWLGSEFEDAARLSGARSWRAWVSINAPLLLPAILAAGLIAFAEALSDFGTAATIAQSSNVTLVTYQIYSAINTAPVDFGLAAALSLKSSQPGVVISYPASSHTRRSWAVAGEPSSNMARNSSIPSWLSPQLYQRSMRRSGWSFHLSCVRLSQPERRYSSSPMRQERLGHCCQRHHSDLSQGQDRHAEHYQTRRLLRIVPIPMPAASNTTMIPMSKVI